MLNTQNMKTHQHGNDDAAIFNKVRRLSTDWNIN